ncbi:MAG TPA: rhamnulokinase family protein [Rhodoglobus sp.]|nr:rhamnulokinase family protein [Rhodoglobus sp.]
MSGSVAAVDLGATSGRVMLGHVGHDQLSIRMVSRFPNGPVRTADGELRWALTELLEHVLDGLTAAVREQPDVASLGVDSWAVDYALLQGGRMLGEPFHYRDERNHAAVERVHALVPPEQLYAANGLQHLPFNTVFQLAAERHLDVADALLLIPDLIAYRLTGRMVAERSNASTTGLLSVTTGDWDAALIERVGLPLRLLPELVDAGTVVGPLLPEVRARIGSGLDVIAVGSHDTASAVLAVPAATRDFAYISCGTWGLVGVELDRPVLTEDARLANFTNEGGVDGTIRFLHNVMGLWLLSECVREWGETDLPGLLDRAAAVTAPVGVFDPNDEVFLPPDGMPQRIERWLAEHDQPLPASRPELVRCIVESLATAFATAVQDASALSGQPVSVIHLVGGGSQNELLCQLTADRSGLPVLAGPVEATAIGNVLVQARAQGFVQGDLMSLRALVARASSPRRYEPRA